MSDASPHGTGTPWPPLIVASHVPILIRARDWLLTSLMWVIFLYLAWSEANLFFGESLGRLGLTVGDDAVDGLVFLGGLRPFIRVILILIALLFIGSLFTLRRRRMTLAVPTPEPLGLAADARRAGLDEPTLAAARMLEVAVVHFEPDGRHRVEPR